MYLVTHKKMSLERNSRFSNIILFLKSCIKKTCKQAPSRRKSLALNMKVAEIVPFKSHTICKRRNKGNLTLKSNSNKIMLCGAGPWGQHYLIWKKIFTIF